MSQRDEQWVIWFNNLPIEDRAKILGIDLSDYDDENCSFNLIAVNIDTRSNWQANSERFWGESDDDLPII